MNAIGIIFLLVSAAALLMLPLRWAPMPLLAGACYMTLGQGVEVAGLHFPVIRLLIAAGFVRVLLRGERLVGSINGLDYLMLMWAMWAVASGLFHESPSDTVVARLGLVFNACGVYFLLRIFCRSMDDAANLCRFTAFLLLPLALAMLSEQLSGRNLFSILGGVQEFSEVRNGVIRAQGPFAHSILAGSVGAVCIPLMIAIWPTYRLSAIAGLAACGLMVLASASSGPILSAAFAVGATVMWYWRRHVRMLRWLALVAYVALDLIMKAPAYYLLARIDLTGSSTSWHRAELIHAAIQHFSEWALTGTDYTRHWMPYGVPWSANHTDITNYYINMGVYGGLALMLLFIAVLAKAFSYVGQSTPQRTSPIQNKPSHQEEESKSGVSPSFLMWAFGSSLFSHAATLMSVSYFDQSVLFLYLTLAAISVGHATTNSALASRAFSGGTAASLRIQRRPTFLRKWPNIVDLNFRGTEDERLKPPIAQSPRRRGLSRDQRDESYTSPAFRSRSI